MVSILHVDCRSRVWPDMQITAEITQTYDLLKSAIAQSNGSIFLLIRFFHQSHNTVHFGGLFTLRQWIFSSLKHDPVPRENKLYCFYVKNLPKRIALWDRENSQ